MGETFYSVLGVESDADTEAIRDAYRARVKETHPDVSDDDDAVDRFKRLTAARDVLVDDTSRSRYDRVGHTVYVRDHLDSSAWSVDDTSSGRRSGGSRSADSGTGSGTSTGGSRGQSSQSGGGSTAENYQRYQSDHDATGSSGSDGNDRRRRTGRNGRTTGPGRADTGGRDTAEGDASDAAADGTAAGGTDDEYGTWSTDAGQDWAFSGSSGSDSTATGGHSADPRDRARADGWQTAHAASNAYTPSGFEPTATGVDEVGSATLRDALQAVGPWLAFHFVFLISAFVTIWLIMTWLPSVPTLFVSLLLLGATVFFSILHMVSQVYS